MGHRFQLFTLAGLICGCVASKSIGQIPADDGQAEDAAMESAAEEQLEESGGTSDEYPHPCQELNYSYKDPKFAWHQSSLVDTAKLQLKNRDQVIALGRVLFYDPQLSADSAQPGRACASCHQPERAFAGAGPVAAGERDVPALINLRWFPEGEVGHPGRGGFFHDGRARTVEDAVWHSLEDPHFLGADVDALPKQLRQLEYYPALFERAFATDEVSSEQLVTAMSAFLRAYTSSTAKGDILYGVLEVDNQIPTEQDIKDAIEQLSWEGIHAGHVRGLKLYYGSGRCDNCHGAWPADFRVSFANIGLDQESEDPGLAAITMNDDHLGAFKAPFLRSLKVTGPYMHDGRFDSLDEVLDHYAGDKAKPKNLHLLVDSIPAFNEADLAAIQSFIDLWHDAKLLADLRFHDPFECGDE